MKKLLAIAAATLTVGAVFHAEPAAARLRIRLGRDQKMEIDKVMQSIQNNTGLFHCGFYNVRPGHDVQLWGLCYSPQHINDPRNEIYTTIEREKSETARTPTRRDAPQR